MIFFPGDCNSKFDQSYRILNKHEQRVFLLIDPNKLKSTKNLITWGFAVLLMLCQRKKKQKKKKAPTMTYDLLQWHDKIEFKNPCLSDK